MLPSLTLSTLLMQCALPLCCRSAWATSTGMHTNERSCSRLSCLRVVRRDAPGPLCKHQSSTARHTRTRQDSMHEDTTEADCTLKQTAPRLWHISTSIDRRSNAMSLTAGVIQSFSMIWTRYISRKQKTRAGLPEIANSQSQGNSTPCSPTTNGDACGAH